MAPFVEGSTAVPVPLGVSSVSIDPHKYGMSGKGASILLLKSEEYALHCLYASDNLGSLDLTFLGCTLGFGVSSAWAAMKTHGFNRYKQNATRIIETLKYLKAGVIALGLHVLGEDEVCVLAFRGGNPLVDSGIKKFMKQKDWHVSFLVNPMCLHVSLTLPFCSKADAFLADLK